MDIESRRTMVILTATVKMSHDHHPSNIDSLTKVNTPPVRLALSSQRL
jgi:hypothetical protein